MAWVPGLALALCRRSHTGTKPACPARHRLKRHRMTAKQRRADADRSPIRTTDDLDVEEPEIHNVIVAVTERPRAGNDVGFLDRQLTHPCHARLRLRAHDDLADCDQRLR